MGPFGGILTMLIFDRYGRKNIFFWMCMLELAGWTIISTASSTSRDWMFAQVLIGRLFTGLAHGLAVGPCSVYAAEISHASIRGRALSMVTVISTLGLLLVYLLGYFMPVSFIQIEKRKV